MKTMIKAWLYPLCPALIILMFSACGKQKAVENFNFLGKNNTTKEFVIRVTGVENFSCNFDSTNKTMDFIPEPGANDELFDNDQPFEPEEQSIEKDKKLIIKG